MYRSYGDKDFFELGILVDEPGKSDGVFDMLLCRPYTDAEDLFQFSAVSVDINDAWIDKTAVMSFAGMTEEAFDPLHFAIACTEYYSWENFGAGGFPYVDGPDWRRMTRADIMSALAGFPDIDSASLTAVAKEAK